MAMAVEMPRRPAWFPHSRQDLLNGTMLPWAAGEPDASADDDDAAATDSDVTAATGPALLPALRAAVVLACLVCALFVLDLWHVRHVGYVDPARAGLDDVQVSQRTGSAVTVTLRARARLASYLHAARVDGATCDLYTTRSHVATLTLLSNGGGSTSIGSAAVLRPRALPLVADNRLPLAARMRLSQLDTDALYTALRPYLRSVGMSNINSNSSSGGVNGGALDSVVAVTLDCVFRGALLLFNVPFWAVPVPRYVRSYRHTLNLTEVLRHGDGATAAVVGGSWTARESKSKSKGSVDLDNLLRQTLQLDEHRRLTLTPATAHPPAAVAVVAAGADTAPTPAPTRYRKSAQPSSAPSAYPTARQYGLWATVEMHGPVDARCVRAPLYFSLPPLSPRYQLSLPVL